MSNFSPTFSQERDQVIGDTSFVYNGFEADQFFDRYFIDSIVRPDTTIRVNFTVSDYQQNSIYCFDCRTYDNLFYHLENKDSVSLSVQKILAPHLGTLAAKEVIVRDYEIFNQGRYSVLRDHVNMDTLRKYKPECFELGFEYEAAIQLNPHVWYTFNFFVDLNGNILDPQSIPLGVRNYDNMDLITFKEAFELAEQDPYMKDLHLSRQVELKYSKGMQLFYYELSEREGELYKEVSGGGSYLQKHIFIDAKTGKTLWRIKAEHQHWSGGCLIMDSVVLPKSKLTGEPHRRLSGM